MEETGQWFSGADARSTLMGRTGLSTWNLQRLDNKGSLHAEQKRERPQENTLIAGGENVITLGFYKKAG